MKSAVETLDETRVKLTVEVSLEELQPSLDRAYESVAQQVNIPGFRKGKVPPRIIDQRVGKGVVIEQAVNDALPGLYRDAVLESDIQPLGQPEVEVTAVPGVSEDSNELVFTAEVDVRPEITLPELSEITLTVDGVEVSEDDVQEELKTLRERYATLVSVERAAADGDFVTLDMSAKIEDEEIDTVSGVSYQIGSGNMLDGLDEALIGLSAGETTTFSSELVGGERAGESAQVTVTASAIKEQELPEVDDDFAQTASEHDTLDELTESLRTQASDGKRNSQAISARDKLIDHLIEVTEFSVPSGAVEAEVTRHLAGEGREEDTEHAEEVRTQTTDGLRRQLLLDALAEQIEVKVGQNEVLEFMLNTARQYQMDPNELIQNAAQNGQMPSFIAEVTRNKSVAVALRQVKVVDEAGEDVDLSDYIGTDEEDEQIAAAEQAAADAAQGGIPEGDEETEAVDVVEVEADSAEDAAQDSQDDDSASK